MHSVLDKFTGQFLLQPTQDPVEHDSSTDEDPQLLNVNS